MRLILGVAVLWVTGAARAVVVADFAADFENDGTPKAGWSYLWNQNGPLTDAFLTAQTGNFVPLVHDAGGVGGYQTLANGAWPDAAPGGFARVTATEVYPGQTALQNAIQRFVIVAYTFSAGDVNTNGNQLFFHTYDFDLPASLPAPIDVFVFKNAQPIFFSPAGFGPPGFSDIEFGQDYSFGSVQANDTLYIALGARDNYQGDPLGVAFTLALVPEPASAGLLAGTLASLRRRRL